MYRYTGSEPEAEQIDAVWRMQEIELLAWRCSCIYCGESGEIACKTEGKICPWQISQSWIAWREFCSEVQRVLLGSHEEHVWRRVLF